MRRAKCGCHMWETRNGDTEEYICPQHAGPTICFIGEFEDCKHLQIEGEDEVYCGHPDLDEEIMEYYCPRIVEQIMEDQDGEESDCGC